MTSSTNLSTGKLDGAVIQLTELPTRLRLRGGWRIGTLEHHLRLLDARLCLLGQREVGHFLKVLIPRRRSAALHTDSFRVGLGMALGATEHRAVVIRLGSVSGHTDVIRRQVTACERDAVIALIRRLAEDVLEGQVSPRLGVLKRPIRYRTIVRAS